MKACACTSLSLVDSKPADGIYKAKWNVYDTENWNCQFLRQSHRQDTNKIDYKGWERTEQTLTLLKNYQ